MKRKLDSRLAALARIVCCSTLLLAGCVGVAPPSGPPPPARPGGVQSGQRDSGVGGHGEYGERTPASGIALGRVDLPERPQAPAIDLIGAPDDLFERVRRGFAMPELDDDLVRRHQQWYLERPDYLRRMVDRGRLYLYHVVEELDKRGMPMELALLPMVESAYNPMARSRSRASGLWQFIPATGKRYNLDQDWWKDERRDVVASTAAALEYLRLVYEQHGDWHLALASYNWGENAVGRAIDRNQARGLPTDYPNLKLPGETRNYVPKLQALKNIFRDPALMAELDLPRVPNRPYFTTYTADSHIDVQVAAKLAEMPMEEFVALNPAHNRPVILSGTPLAIPAEKLETFVGNLEAYGSGNKPLSTWRTYTLRPGDRLEGIAPRFGMTVARLKAVNGIRGRTRPAPGMTLLVQGSDRNANAGSPGKVRPAAGKASISPVAIPQKPSPKTTLYTVRPGDTIYSIARRFKVAEEDLMRRNQVRPETLKAGTTLTIPAENS
ncbi:MAG: LysM peptidoglycan-binding domain-containing protein [Candidatus Accumulibacter sp.]|jgi:membrane-bound lytic murein transglycosylase D|nr:LysM peptidoglycan-binding domain-containing protein [Accumulibacter sp.]